MGDLSTFDYEWSEPSVSQLIDKTIDKIKVELTQESAEHVPHL